MNIETDAGIPDAIQVHAQRVARAVALRALYRKWAEELRLRAWADYYADLFLGVFIGVVGVVIFGLTTKTLYDLAQNTHNSLAVILRCIAWQLSATCVLVLAILLGAYVMRIKSVVAFGGAAKWTLYTLMASLVFGLVGVFPFAFIKL